MLEQNKLLHFLKQEKFLLAGIILLNITIKLFYLNAFPLSGDEPFTVFCAQFSLPELFEMLKTENNPPLQYLLMHFWIKLAGISAVAVRIPSLIFSVCAVIFIFKIGSKFYTISVALFASLLYTFSSYHMLFSHEARVYSLFALLTSASMYFFLKCVSQKNSKRDFIWLAIFNILLIYAHFFGFFILLVQGICSIYFIVKNRSFFKKIAIVYGTIALAYSPYLSILFSRYSASSSHGTWVEPPAGLIDLYYMLWRFTNAPLPAILLLALSLIALFLFIKNKDTLSTNTKVILVWTFIPFFVMYLLSFKVPMFLDRYLIFVSIGFYLCFAIAFDYATQMSIKYFKPIGLLFITLLMIFTFNPIKEKEKRKFNECVDFIKEMRKEDPTIVVLIAPKWSYRNFAYFYNINYFKDYKNTLTLLNKENIFAIDKIHQLKKISINKNTPILFIDDWASLIDTKMRLQQFIDNPNYKKEKLKFGDVNVTLRTKK